MRVARSYYCVSLNIIFVKNPVLQRYSPRNSSERLVRSQGQYNCTELLTICQYQYILFSKLACWLSSLYVTVPLTGRPLVNKSVNDIIVTFHSRRLSNLKLFSHCIRAFSLGDICSICPLFLYCYRLWSIQKNKCCHIPCQSSDILHGDYF